MANFTPLFQTLLGAIVGGGFALGGVLLTMRNQQKALTMTLRHQADQETLKDARALRDRRYERQSGGYEGLLASAWVMQNAARRVGVCDLGSPTTFISENLGEATRAQVRLVLDEATSDVRACYKRVSDAYAEYWNAGDPEPRQVKLQELDQLVDELEKVLRARLEELRQPIAQLPDALLRRGSP